MITDDQQNQLNSFFASNPSTGTSGYSPTGNTDDWYTQMKQGAYRPAGMNTPETPAQPSYTSEVGSNLKDTFKQGANNIISDVTDNPQKTYDEASKGETNPIVKGAEAGLTGLSAAGHVAGDVAGTAGNILGSFLTPLIPDSVKQTLGDATKWIEDKVNSIPGMTPEIAKSLGDVFNTASLAVGEKGEPKVTNAVSDVTDAAKNGLTDAKNALVGTPEEQAAKLAASKEAGALKDVVPSYENATPAEKLKLASSPTVDGVPRVQEGGTFSGRTVTATAMEKEAAQELSKVPGYDPSMTNLEKQQLIQKEISTRGESLTKGLSQEKVVVSPNKIIKLVKDAIGKVPDESLLLQKSDPAISNYMRVVRNAVAQNDGTLEGVNNVRKALDKAYENARGNSAFGSDKIAAIDDIYKAARNSLTQYLIDTAKGTDVKASLRGQFNLYRAADEISSRAAKEAGSGVGRAVQKIKAIPGAKTAIKLGSRVLGTGAAVEGLNALK